MGTLHLWSFAFVFILSYSAVFPAQIPIDGLRLLRERLQEFPNKCGYVDVRPEAHMFWWLFYSTHPNGYRNRPLIIWLQGGPGASSTGYGNFAIVGPLDEKYNYRNFTWVKEASILFVDNPVGAGFSYVDTEDALTTDVHQIAEDLLVFYQTFLEENEEYRTVPLYIFGQSYGGKMATMFSKYLYKSIGEGEIDAQFRGYAMGNSWISPEDSVMTWAPLLLWMSWVDEVGYNAIQSQAKEVQAAIHSEQWELASDLWGDTQNEVMRATNGYVDFYDIMGSETFVSRKRDMSANEMSMAFHIHPSSSYSDLEALMNGDVKAYLECVPNHINWNEYTYRTFDAHSGDFMKPVVDTVAELLETTNLDVIVYQGQLDLICDTKGALDWVQKMQWSEIENYNNAPRLALSDPKTGEIETYVKSHKNFSFYWNLKATHSVPAVGNPALRMLKRIINSNADIGL